MKNLLYAALAVLLVNVLILDFFLIKGAKETVYIDTALLLDQYHGMRDARAEFQKKSTGWQANIDTLQSELQQSIMTYEKEVKGMTAKEKELSKQLIQTKQKQFRDYQHAIQQQSQQEDAVMTQQVLDKVNAFIKSYGEKQGYDIILGTSQGNIVYARENLDITDEVVGLLNDEYLGL